MISRRTITHLKYTTFTCKKKQCISSVEAASSVSHGTLKTNNDDKSIKISVQKIEEISCLRFSRTSIYIYIYIF